MCSHLRFSLLFVLSDNYVIIKVRVITVIVYQIKLKTISVFKCAESSSHLHKSHLFFGVIIQLNE